MNRMHACQPGSPPVRGGAWPAPHPGATVNRTPSTFPAVSLLSHHWHTNRPHGACGRDEPRCIKPQRMHAVAQHGAARQPCGGSSGADTARARAPVPGLPCRLGKGRFQVRLQGRFHTPPLGVCMAACSTPVLVHLECIRNACGMHAECACVGLHTENPAPLRCRVTEWTVGGRADSAHPLHQHRHK